MVSINDDSDKCCGENGWSRPALSLVYVRRILMNDTTIEKNIANHEHSSEHLQIGRGT